VQLVQVGFNNPEKIVMSHYHIAIVVGSLRNDSINKKLASALEKMAPFDFLFDKLEIGDLPLITKTMKLIQLSLSRS